MRRGRHLRARVAGLRSAGVRQLLVGLLALPLSALPLAAYLNLTPEGRLVLDRALVALSPPELPRLTAAQRAAAVEAAPRYGDAVMALAYHGIGSSSDAEGGFVIPPGRFAEHLAVLKAAGMRAVTAAQVAESLDTGLPLPDNAVMISFDDGRTDAMMFADPLLEQARMSATMFVITGAAAEPGVYYASWGKLESYAKSGRWDLQAHTAELHRQHDAAGGDELPALTSLVDGESLEEYRDRVRTDLADSANAIERHTGRRPVAFAYPFGAYGAERTNSPAIREVLRAEVDRRFSIAFHQDEQDSVPLVTAGDDRFGLRRLEVEDWTGMELLARIGDAAGRTAGAAVDGPPAVDPGPYVVPLPDRELPPVVVGDPDLTIPPVGTVPPPRTPRTPATTAPPRTRTTTPPPTGAPTTTSPPPPTAPAPTTSPPAPTTTAPPAPTTTTTRPPVTTTTTRPPAPTTTTTTTLPNGCRSRGQGNVCKDR